MAVGVIEQIKFKKAVSGTTGTESFTSTPTEGNLLLMGIAVDGSAGNLANQGTWTSHYNQENEFVSFATRSKLAGASDSGPHGFDWDNSQEYTLVIIEVSGTTVVDDYENSSSGGSSVTTLTTGPITPSVTESFAVAIYGIDNDSNWTPGTYTNSMTEKGEDGAAGDPKVSVGELQLLDASAFSTAYETTDTGDQAVGTLFILIPDTGTIIPQNPFNKPFNGPFGGPI